jgi:hypothetical protein
MASVGAEVPDPDTVLEVDADAPHPPAVRAKTANANTTGAAGRLRSCDEIHILFPQRCLAAATLPQGPGALGACSFWARTASHRLTLHRSRSLSRHAIGTQCSRQERRRRGPMIALLSLFARRAGFGAPTRWWWEATGQKAYQVRPFAILRPALSHLKRAPWSRARPPRRRPRSSPPRPRLLLPPRSPGPGRQACCHG